MNVTASDHKKFHLYMIHTQTLFRHIVTTLLVFVAAVTAATADDSGTGWSYDSTTNTLTLSGREVDWEAIKDFKYATEHVVFADDYAVISIPDEAFSSFTKLIEIEIPDVVTSIGDYAFYFCTTLTSVTLPKGLTSVEESSFSHCEFLASISLPASLTSIGDCAFEGCTSLNTVEILSNGTSDDKHIIYLGDGNETDNAATGTYVFPQYQATLVYDPNKTWIGDDETQQNLRYYFNEFKLLGGNGWSYTTTTNTLTLFGYEVDWDAIKDFSSTTEHVVFAEDYAVSSIPDEAFSGFTNLKDTEIPSVVTSIGESAFYGCTSLTSVTLPSGLSSIGRFAFCGCGSLTSVTLPSGLTSIGEAAFRYCLSLASVTLPDGLTSIGDYAFYECRSLASVSLPDGLTTLGDYVFYGCTSLTSVFLPDGLTLLGECAFFRTSLTSVTLPSGLTSIDVGAFAYCSSLTSITLSSGLTSISRGAFYGCTSLASVTLPSGVTSIGWGAFSGCSSLTSITLPASVTSIGNEAFNGCSSLNTVEILSNGTSDDKHFIYLGDSDDKAAAGTDVFPRDQTSLIYDPNTTWIGDDDTQNLRYYFNSFATPTSLPTIDASNSTSRFYDLGGRPVSPSTHKGIAVKLQDGKASLITTK